MARTNAVRAMISMGLRMNEEDCMRELNEVIAEFSSNYEHHFEKLLLRIGEETYRGLNPAVLVASAVSAYHDTKFKQLKPFEDVKPALDALSRTGVRLGVITMGPQVKQAEKLLVEEIAAMAPIYYYTGPNLSKPWLTRLQRGIGGNHFALWKIDWEAKKAATGATGDKVTLNWNLGTEPPTADPALATDTTSVDLDEQLFLGLTDFDDVTSEVIPELATSWEVSDDGLTWTFHLRDDVYWVRYNTATKEVEQVLDDEGNPRKVTAYDIEYAVKRTLDPRTGSDYAYVLYIIKNGEAVNTMEY